MPGKWYYLFCERRLFQSRSQGTALTSCFLLWVLLRRIFTFLGTKSVSIALFTAYFFLVGSAYFGSVECLYAYRWKLAISHQIWIQEGVSPVLCRFFAFISSRNLIKQGLQPLITPWKSPGLWSTQAADQEVPHSLDISSGVEMSINVCMKQ